MSNKYSTEDCGAKIETVKILKNVSQNSNHNLAILTG